MHLPGMQATVPLLDAPLAELISARAEIDRLRAENDSLRKEVATLKHQLDELKRLIFGAKSERFVPASHVNQPTLFDEEDAPAEMPPQQTTFMVTRQEPAAKRAPSRQLLPSHLPREVIMIEPEGDTSSLKRIGEVVTETLDYVPGKLKVIRRVRPKYVDPADEERGVIIAALPKRLIEKGIAEPGLLAHVMIDKYVDHLPLYRQRARFRRAGISLPPSTLGGWIAKSAWHLEPLYAALKQEILQSGYLQADETTIAVQDAQKKEGKTHRGYYWVYHAPQEGLLVMEYRKGRAREGPKAFLGAYTGALQSDGYAVYDGFDAVEAITTYGCWAHARRYFLKALASEGPRATQALEQIKQLYAIERRLRAQGASPALRTRVRQREAVPILRALKARLQAYAGLPKSPWGQAVHYSLQRWEKLCRYVDDGRIEIDNNRVENAIRPIALGRKNYLFAGSHTAAQRAAVIYSLLGTCKQHDVNPQDWLSDVLARIPTHRAKRVHELLPHRWQAPA